MFAHPAPLANCNPPLNRKYRVAEIARALLCMAPSKARHAFAGRA